MRIRSNAKDRWKRQVGAVASCLIPTLYSGADGAGDDGEVEYLGNAPFVQNLVTQYLNLIRFESLGAVYLFVAVGVLGDQSALLEHGEILVETLVVGEVFHIAEELATVDSKQRVFDPERRSVRYILERNSFKGTDLASLLSFRSTVAWDPRRAFSMFDTSTPADLVLLVNEICEG